MLTPPVLHQSNQQSTLLVLSNESDLHADLIVAECHKRGIRLIRVNLDTWQQGTAIDLSLYDLVWSGVLRVRGQPDIFIDDINGVWYRDITTTIPESTASPTDRFLNAEFDATLVALTNILADRRWINSPNALSIANDKTNQLSRAAHIGLTIPRTILTMNPISIREFIGSCCDTVIAKRLSAPNTTDPAIYTTKLSKEMLDRQASDFRSCPTLLQEHIEKAADIRVVVVGDSTFGILIHSQDDSATALDWRKVPASKLRCTPHSLPTTISASLVKLTASYGLRYSSPDLILTPDGRYVFLELNPVGQWGWIEALTGLPITAKLVDELLQWPLDAGDAPREYGPTETPSQNDAEAP